VRVILSLGSNLGDRRANLQAAHDALAARPGIRIVARAPIYETEPVGVPDRYRAIRYYNTILVVDSELAPEDCSDAVHAIEARLGRRRGAKRNVPRLIDIDLIACGAARRDTPALRLPHPEAIRRRFVLQPLADVCSDLVLPGQALTVRELLAELPPTPAVALAGEQWE
jgi:2-amino-4-hydroxy-6-hydroxymethyldihydropteridine diphosphokinase